VGRVERASSRAVRAGSELKPHAKIAKAAEAEGRELRALRVRPSSLRLSDNRVHFEFHEDCPAKPSKPLRRHWTPCHRSRQRVASNAGDRSCEPDCRPFTSPESVNESKPVEELSYIIASDGLLARRSGEWAKRKHHYLRNYCGITTKSMRRKWRLVYLDVMAGPGLCKIKETADEFDGSPFVGSDRCCPALHDKFFSKTVTTR